MDRGGHDLIGGRLQITVLNDPLNLGSRANINSSNPTVKYFTFPKNSIFRFHNHRRETRLS